MSNDGVDTGRRRMLTVATGVVGGVGAVAATWPFLASLKPSERAKALGAPVAADISNLQPGQMTTVEWRGKPVWIVRRTPEMLAALPTIEDRLADPKSTEPQQPDYAKNEYRSIKPEFLVLIGSCTHLGCSPNFRPEAVAAPDVGEGWKGGFYCPCHGSKFDLAGRVYKGVPAPSNLVVPPYRFETDTVIVIGEDKGVA